MLNLQWQILAVITNKMVGLNCDINDDDESN
jgi:hypothetical protein